MLHYDLYFLHHFFLFIVRYRLEERRLRVRFKPQYYGQRLVDLDRELRQMFDSILARV